MSRGGAVTRGLLVVRPSPDDVSRDIAFSQLLTEGDQTTFALVIRDRKATAPSPMAPAQTYAPTNPTLVSRLITASLDYR